MGNLLRKRASAQTCQIDESAHRYSPFPFRHKRQSQIDLSTGVESPKSIELRQQLSHQRSRSITQLSRSLVRKASTFNLSLSSKHRTRQSKLSESQTRSEDLFPETAELSIQCPSELYQSRPKTASTVYSEAPESFINSERTSNNSADSQITTIPVRRDTLLSTTTFDRSHLSQAIQNVFAAQDRIVEAFPAYREKHHDSVGVWAKMAAPTAAPPLPYEKLKQITVDACDNTLASIKSYDHSKTETWNTTIINTILAELVGETSSTANGTAASAPQSKFKFVVNSTIVQHKSNTIDESGKGQGRRGMHSAAGAYWNNEKDGMWSFKYEAAERMGLDVVVGIVWIWVG